MIYYIIYLCLMADSGSVLHRIMEIDRIFVDKKAGEIAKLAYGLRKKYVRDKDVLTLKGLLKAEQIKKKKKYVSKENDETPIDWDEMFAKAKNETFKTNNPYYIRARNWNLKFKHRFKIAKNLHRKENFLRSPEYDDLEAFLQVCRAEKIKPLLVILPLNGRWYDYTGLKKDKRKVFADKITEYAQAYGAKLENFSKYDYVPAATAAGHGASTLLLERMDRPGRKLRICGKGRGNIGNTAPMDEFLNHFGKGFRFLRPAFSHFFTGDSVEFFARLGVPTKVERGGRIFPESDNAQDLVDALVRNAKNQGATIQTGRRIRKIQFTGTGFELFSDQTYRGRHVVLATKDASSK